MWTDRTKVLIGQNGVDKLANCHVAVIGVGGVGGYVATLLARSGVGNLTIVDFDKVDETNINRQLVANTKTVGEAKVDVLKKQILDINPGCNIKTLQQKICKENIAQILSEKYDYVVDAIDSVKDKLELICYCKENGIEIVSAMGAGNRVCIPNFQVMDIFKTSNDGLAKVMRKNLRQREVKSLTVVTSQESVIKHEENVVGSISYQPAMCGCVIAGFVINSLLKD